MTDSSSGPSFPRGRRHVRRPYGCRRSSRPPTSLQRLLTTEHAPGCCAGYFRARFGVGGRGSPVELCAVDHLVDHDPAGLDHRVCVASAAASLLVGAVRRPRQVRRIIVSVVEAPIGGERRGSASWAMTTAGPPCFPVVSMSRHSERALTRSRRASARSHPRW